MRFPTVKYHPFIISGALAIVSILFAIQKIDTLAPLRLFSSAKLIYILFVFCIAMLFVVLKRNYQFSYARLRAFFYITFPSEIILLIAVNSTDRIHYVFHIATAFYLVALGLFVISGKKSNGHIVSYCFNHIKSFLYSVIQYYRKQGILVFTILAIIFIAYLAFGTYHLGKAAYVDEPLWAYERIEKYWKNIGERDWRNVRPSDKPGVTVAILSGGALLFEDPGSYDEGNENKETLDRFFFSLRFPLLFFTACSFFIFYAFIERLFHKRVALLSVVFMGTSSLLLGMSRVVNPDGILWVFVALSLLAYLYFRKSNSPWALWITGIILGLGLLTKYVANLLFVYILFVIIFYAITKKSSRSALNAEMRTQLKNYAILSFAALSTFLLLFPGVWVKHDRILLGTISSQAFDPIAIPFIVILAIIVSDTLLFKSAVLFFLARTIGKYKVFIYRIIAAAFLLSFVAVLVHAYIPFLPYNFESILSSPKSSHNVVGISGLYFAAFYPIIFGILPIACLGLAVTLWHIIFSKKDSSDNTYAFLIIFFIIASYIGTILSGVAATVRYQIMLYPLFFILAAYGWHVIFLRASRKIFLVFLSFVFFCGIAVLWNIKPFYFIYSNILLPQDQIANVKQMGNGSYEAAEFLNAIPNAQTLSIWSDKRGVCQFFVGTCRTTPYDPAYVTDNVRFDYYVLSSDREQRMRGLIEIRVNQEKPNVLRFDTLYDIADEKLVHTVTPGNRKKSFVRVIDGATLDLRHNKNNLNYSDDFIKDVATLSPLKIPARICNIADYDATPNDAGTAIARAINDCADQGGGTVQIPRGTWHTGPIHLRSNIALEALAGARIEFSTNPDDYLPPVPSRFIGLELNNSSPLIYARDCTNVAIRGKGVFDGNGDAWQHFLESQKEAIKKLYQQTFDGVPLEERTYNTTEDSLRPSFVQFFNCDGVELSGATFIEGPMWTIHPIYSNNVLIDDITVKTKGINTDGIVIDSSQNVLIRNVTLSTGDDAITLKSGRDVDGWRVDKPTRNVVVEKCRIVDGHGGIFIGSEMSGGIENVLFSDCFIDGIDHGLRIKTSKGRGGYVRNIYARNLKLQNIHKTGIHLNMNYGSSSIRPQSKRMPIVEGIFVDNATISGAHAVTAESSIAIRVRGHDERNIRDASFENISGTTKEGVFIKHGENISLKNINVSHENSTKPLIVLDNSKNITLEDFSCLRVEKFIAKENTTSVSIMDNTPCPYHK